MCGHKRLRMYAELHALQQVRQSIIECFGLCENEGGSDLLHGATNRVISRRAIEMIFLVREKMELTPNMSKVSKRTTVVWQIFKLEVLVDMVTRS